jgi:hypothetical protein
MKIDFDAATLTVNILRNWDREKIERFAKHLLGEKCEKCEKVVENGREQT